MNEPLVQQILNLIYQGSDVRRMYKEAVTNWILDTQPRTAPLDATPLLEYLAVYHPDLLNRLKVNVHIKDDLARALASVDRN